MRILLVNWHPAVVGGVEQYLRSIVPHLLQRGHTLAFLYGYEQPADNPAAAVFPGEGEEQWCFESLGLRRTLEMVDRWTPDLVWVNMIESVELERELCRRYATVFFAHTYDLTCPAGMKLWKTPRALPCTCPSGAHCLALHYIRRCGGLSPVTMWRGWRRQQERLQHAGGYRGFIVAGEHMRNELLANGIDPALVHTAPLFPPGIRPDPQPPARRPISGQLLFVGRLVSVKGADYALRAVDIVERILGIPLSVTMAGDGPELSALRHLADNLGVKVSFRGWLDVEARLALMRGCDLLLIPSIWPEPFGLVGVEASCVGLPSIAFDLGGIRDWLRPGDSGEVADAHPPTVEGFAQAILRALSNPDHFTKLREGAWRASLGRSREQHAARLEAIFKQAVPEGVPELHV